MLSCSFTIIQRWMVLESRHFIFKRCYYRIEYSKSRAIKWMELASMRVFLWRWQRPKFLHLLFYSPIYSLSPRPRHLIEDPRIMVRLVDRIMRVFSIECLILFADMLCQKIPNKRETIAFQPTLSIAVAQLFARRLFYSVTHAFMCV